MSDYTISNSDSASLRQKAEESWLKSHIEITNTRDQEDQKIFHELQVHQIELEMQNEELQRVQADLEKSHARYYELYNQAPVGYITISDNGIILGANLAVENMLGLGQNAILQQPITHFIHRDDQDSYYLFRRKLFDSGEKQHGEFRLVRQDGSFIWARVDANLAHDENSQQAICRVTLNDITDRKQAEGQRAKLEQQIQQMQRLESLGLLAGGIAHDFNNILMVILGNAQLAGQELPPTSKTKERINQIESACEQAADLCRQMLAYAGKATIFMEKVNISKMIEDTANLLRAAISKKSALSLKLEHNIPNIMADPVLIRQIIMNLIINASESIGDENGEIVVTTGELHCNKEYFQSTEFGEDLDPGNYVYFEVKDSGCGMNFETRRKIFDAFYSTKFIGRGLGLAAVMGILRMHKGALQIQSEPGKGSTFRVLFPGTDKQIEIPFAAQLESLSVWQGHGTILLVDDEESLRFLGKEQLELLGFTVLTANNGAHAVDVYRQKGKEIDLVILDLTMPNMDGAEALAELLTINPDIRVILASGYNDQEVAARFSGKKIVGVLQKPYSIERLKELLGDLAVTGPE